MLALATPGSTLADSLDDDPPKVVDPCMTADGVVGRRRCPRYGTWGEPLEGPYVFVRFGGIMRQLPSESAATAPSSRTTTATAALPTDTYTSYTVLEQISF